VVEVALTLAKLFGKNNYDDATTPTLLAFATLGKATHIGWFTVYAMLARVKPPATVQALAKQVTLLRHVSATNFVSVNES